MSWKFTQASLNCFKQRYLPDSQGQGSIWQGFIASFEIRCPSGLRSWPNPLVINHLLSESFYFYGLNQNSEIHMECIVSEG